MAEEKTNTKFYFGVGRRKTATARARVYVGVPEVEFDGKKLVRGDIAVNGKPIDQYFTGFAAKQSYFEVYRSTNTIGRFITTIKVTGSGGTGQLGAIILAICRALSKADPKFKEILNRKGYMTRDPRSKERKKPGLMGARKQKSSPKR